MKKLFTIGACAMALALASCNQENKDSKDLADSLNETKDTTTQVAQTGGISVVEDDAKFAVDAASGGMAEVELSKLALEKSQNAQVKSFAEMMVNDHGKANEKLKSIAATKNITLPTALDEDHQKKWNELNGKAGKDFDKDYVKTMVDGHQKTLDLLKKASKDSQDAELKAFAGETVPTVETHLAAIKKIQDQLK